MTGKIRVVPPENWEPDTPLVAHVCRYFIGETEITERLRHMEVHFHPGELVVAKLEFLLTPDEATELTSLAVAE